MIEVRNLTKAYNGHVAVEDLSFTVEKGQIVGFLGPNGAGKSTTMNIITGYLSATEGQVLVNGIDVFEEPEKAKKCIGYLPESPPLYMDMRVREYLYFVASLKKVPKKKRGDMLEEIMTLTKIMDVSERLIKHLSKGYRQRVGLAGALMGYPDILILDEPTVGLDPMQIIEMRDLIKSLSEKHTIMLSSHIMQEISAVCDTVMIINQGKLLVSDRLENMAKQVQESEELIIKVKGNREKLQTALEGIKNIQSFHIEAEQGAGGLVTATIKTVRGQDCREAIFYAMAGLGFPILEMRISIMTLEDIFLTLTKGGTKQYGGKKDKRRFRRVNARPEDADESIEVEETLEAEDSDGVDGRAAEDEVLNEEKAVTAPVGEDEKGGDA